MCGPFPRVYPEMDYGHHILRPQAFVSVTQRRPLPSWRVPNTGPRYPRT